MSSSAIRGGRVAIEIGADARNFYAALNALQSRIRGLGSTLTGIGSSMAGIGAAAALPFAGALRQSAGFQDTMSAVGAVTGATGRDFDALKQKALDLGASTSFTAQEVADGMQALGQGGFTVGETLSGIEGTLLLARAGMLGLGEASSITVAILRSFKMPVEEAGKVADILSKAANASNANVQGLGEGLSTVGGLAFEAGVSLTELTASLGLLADRGMQASEAGTAMRRVLVGLSQEQDKLKQLGVEVKDPKTGKLKPLKVIMADLNKAMAGMDSTDKIAKLSKIFDVFGANAVAMLMNSVGSWESLDETLQNSEGTAAQVAAQMDDNLGGSFRMLTSAIESVALAVGEALTPALRDAMKWAAGAAAGFGQIVLNNKELVVAALKTVAAIAASGVAFIGVGLTLKALAAAVGGFSGALKFLASPISAAVSASSLLVKSFSGVGGAVSSMALAFARGSIGLVAFAMQSGITAVAYTAAATAMLAQTAATTASIGAWWAGRAVVGLAMFAAEVKARITYYTGALAFITASTVARTGYIAAAWMGVAANGFSRFVVTYIGGVARYVAGAAAMLSSTVATAGTMAAAWLAPMAPVIAIGAAIAGLAYAIQSVDLTGMFSGLPSLLEPLSGAFEGVASTATQAFNSIFSIAQTTFAGIYDAIAAGDMSMAFTVLWAGLSAAWLTGSATIMGYVDQLTEYFQNAWGDAVAWLAVAITNGMGVVEDIWTAATTGMMNAWRYSMNAVMDLWDTAVGAIQKAIAYIRAFFDESIDYDAIKRQVDDANRERKAKRDADVTSADPALARRVKENRDRREAAVEGINQDNAASRAARAQRSVERQSQRQVGVDAATASANAARDEAQARREQAENSKEIMGAVSQAASQDDLRDAYDWAKTSLENGRLTKEQFDRIESAIDEQAVELDSTRAMKAQEDEKTQRDIDAATKAGKDRKDLGMETAGSFSTAAVMGMGVGGSAAERTAKATEEIARNTREMREGARVQS